MTSLDSMPVTAGSASMVRTIRHAARADERACATTPRWVPPTGTGTSASYTPAPARTARPRVSPVLQPVRRKLPN